jgi:hypothetical protein
LESLVMMKPSKLTKKEWIWIIGCRMKEVYCACKKVIYSLDEESVGL